MGIFIDHRKMEKIRQKYEDKTYLPIFVWYVIIIFILAIIALSIWMHYLPE